MKTLLVLTGALILAPVGAYAQQPAAAGIQGYRDPGIATLYSVALPGGGQFYSSETGRGLLILGGSSAAVVAGTALSREASCKYDGSSPYGVACDEANHIPLTIGLLASAGIWGFGIWDARKSAERHNAKLSEKPRGSINADPVVVFGAHKVSVGTRVVF